MLASISFTAATIVSFASVVKLVKSPIFPFTCDSTAVTLVSNDESPAILAAVSIFNAFVKAASAAVALLTSAVIDPFIPATSALSASDLISKASPA